MGAQHRSSFIFARQGSGQWLYTAHNDLSASVHLPSIDCDLPLAEIYDRVVFVSEPEEPESDEKAIDDEQR